VRLTWNAAAAGRTFSGHQIAREINKDWIGQAALSAGYPEDAALFVMDAMTFVKFDRHGPQLTPDGPQHATAADVCAAVREYAKIYFSNPHQAQEALSQWRLQNSEDVGVLIFALADFGLLATSPDDSKEAFEGIFHFDDLIGAIPWRAEPQ
jgi:uncharacterized repeat protein (TIGR04138 family)